MRRPRARSPAKACRSVRRGRCGADARGRKQAAQELDQAGLHLRPRGELRGAVHEPGHDRAVRGLEGDEAVEVVALVLAAVVGEGRVWLGPREQALEEGELSEHAAGRGIGRDDGVVDAQPREVVRDLQAAGPAADYDDAVLAGRERTRVGPGRAGHGVSCGDWRDRAGGSRPGACGTSPAGKPAGSPAALVPPAAGPS